MDTPPSPYAMVFTWTICLMFAAALGWSVLAKLDISEKRVPQDGRMRLVMGPTKTVDFRVSTLPTLFGEKVVLRILDGSAARLGIEAPVPV